MTSSLRGGFRQIEYIPIGDLKPSPRNPRTHSDKQVAKLGKSLTTFGWTTPAITDDQNRILAGHGRVLAASKLGMTEIPCVRLLSGSDDRVVRLWREKRGEHAPEDLSEKLPVMLGCWTEEFNRQRYARSTGLAISRAGERLTCSVHDWRSCTLDGFVEDLGAVWEAKHTSGFTKGDELLQRYMPQVQHNMAVAGCERALLSVIFGNGKWEVYEIASDWLYQEDLLAAEMRFWDCVQSGEAPTALPVPPAPKPIGVREVCLEGNNAWAAHAADWLLHREAARKHRSATTSLRSWSSDVARAFGHKIEIKRSKAGALTIREMGA